MAVSPQQNSFHFRLREHLLGFPRREYEAFIGGPQDFAANRAGTGRDPHIGSRRQRLYGAPIREFCLSGREGRHQNKYCREPDGF
jgi:hypothetical protein